MRRNLFDILDIRTQLRTSLKYQHIIFADEKVLFYHDISIWSCDKTQNLYCLIFMVQFHAQSIKINTNNTNAITLRQLNNQ